MFNCQLTPTNPAHWFVATAVLASGPDVRGRWVAVNPSASRDDYVFEVAGCPLAEVVDGIRKLSGELPDWGWQGDRRPLFFLPHLPAGTGWSSMLAKLGKKAADPLDVESVLLGRWPRVRLGGRQPPVLRFDVVSYPKEPYEQGGHPAEANYAAFADAELVQAVGVAQLIDGAGELLGTVLAAGRPAQLRYPIWSELRGLGEFLSLYPSARGVEWWSADRVKIGKGGLRIDPPTSLGLSYDPEQTYAAWFPKAFANARRSIDPRSTEGLLRAVRRLEVRYGDIEGEGHLPTMSAGGAIRKLVAFLAGPMDPMDEAVARFVRQALLRTLPADEPVAAAGEDEVEAEAEEAQA